MKPLCLCGNLSPSFLSLHSLLTVTREAIRKAFPTSIGQTEDSARLCAAATAGPLCCFLSHPADTIKTCMQVRRQDLPWQDTPFTRFRLFRHRAAPATHFAHLDRHFSGALVRTIASQRKAPHSMPHPTCSRRVTLSSPPTRDFRTPFGRLSPPRVHHSSGRAFPGASPGAAAIYRRPMGCSSYVWEEGGTCGVVPDRACAWTLRSNMKPL